MSGQTWIGGSDKETESQLGHSPVSKPDATERSGSISADEQTQVAVWKPDIHKRS